MPPTQDDLSTLERLRQRLYAPTAPATSITPELHGTPVPQSLEGWGDETPQTPKKPRISFAALFLGIAGIFFLLALAAAAYFLMFGGRAVSTDRISITVDADTDIASGDEIPFIVTVENKNPVTITATSLKIDFPDTARLSEKPDSPPFYEDTLGDIESGGTGTRSVRVTLFGSENERITIPLRFEYRIEGSNATFVKEAEYDVLVSSSPVSIRAEALSEISVGQPVTFAVTVRSSAREPLENVAVLAQYPFGFTLARGQSAMIPVGTLAPGEEKTVNFAGTLSGEDSEERVFRFTVGTRTGDASTLAIPYSTAITPVTIAKPFLGASLSINRDTGTAPVIEAGSSVQGVVTWINTLGAPILDGQVEVKLSGSVLEPSSVSAYGGYYRSADSTLIFSRETSADLAQLAPGETGNGTFTFRTKSAQEIASLRNPTVVATVAVAGRRVGESNVPERIGDVVTRTIKVGTDLKLAARSSYSAGPRPPVANQETRYVITLSLTNTVNSVADAVVSGTLPSYVTYARAITPADGTLAFNETTRAVTWRAGEVAAGQGYGSPARTASFEVVLLPSTAQRGTSPVLMSTPTVTGVDRFTQKQLSNSHASVSTQPQDATAGFTGVVQ
ncbi:MAG TPA: hypothetical protein VNU25_00670 [Candidatus Paceibacterota bacterium]|nr:hypothetical protein [Candidatus Paceibacterota bacterium]